MSEAQFPLTSAQLSGNFCETLFFGMYLVTCTFCAHTLFIGGSGRDERWLHFHEIRWMMVAVALSLFLICTFDVAIGLLHNFNAFIKSTNPEEELRDIADWINIARSANQFMAMILGDFVLIYRCWVVHGRRWLIICPSILLYLGGIAMTGKLLEVEGNPKTQKTITLNSPQIRPWWIAFFAITAIQNVLTTCILIWRIWRVEKESERYLKSSWNHGHQPRHLRKVMRVIAESGAAYTLMVFITFCVSVTRSNALYPTSNMTLQATGIAFNVILVRSSANRERQFTEFDRNERTMFTEHTPRSSTLTTIVHTNISQSHDVELTAQSEGRRSYSPTELYKGGVTVTKSVVHSP